MSLTFQFFDEINADVFKNVNNLIDNFVQYCDWANQIDEKRKVDHKNPLQRNFSKEESAKSPPKEQNPFKRVASPTSRESDKIGSKTKIHNNLGTTGGNKGNDVQKSKEPNKRKGHRGNTETRKKLTRKRKSQLSSKNVPKSPVITLAKRKKSKIQTPNFDRIVQKKKKELLTAPKRGVTNKERRVKFKKKKKRYKSMVKINKRFRERKNEKGREEEVDFMIRNESNQEGNGRVYTRERVY